MFICSRACEGIFHPSDDAEDGLTREIEDDIESEALKKGGARKQKRLNADTNRSLDNINVMAF